MNCKYGTMFSFDTSSEYAETLAGIYNEQGNNYERNVMNDASKAITKARNAIGRDLLRGLDDAQVQVVAETVEHHKDCVYKYFALSSKNQKRVEGLIDKLMEEERRMTVVQGEGAAA